MLQGGSKVSSDPSCDCKLILLLLLAPAPWIFLSQADPFSSPDLWGAVKASVASTPPTFDLLFEPVPNFDGLLEKSQPDRNRPPGCEFSCATNESEQIRRTAAHPHTIPSTPAPRGTLGETRTNILVLTLNFGCDTAIVIPFGLLTQRRLFKSINQTNLSFKLQTLTC